MRRAAVRRVAVLGASGKTGLAVTHALARRGVAVRGLIRRAEQDGAVRAAGAVEAVVGVETVVGDVLDVGALDRLLDGVDALYHLAPNVHPQEEEIARTVFDAAHRAGIERVVYHSVLHPQIEAMPHHWRKMRVEEMLFASPFRWTVLQPSAYMQNLHAARESVQARGVLAVPYSPDARFSLVDLRDVADAASLVLCEDGHEHAVYELAGAKAISSHEMVEIFARLLGREVRAERIGLDAWEEEARRAGLDLPRREALLAMFREYDQHGLLGNGNVLRQLLGRDLRSFEAFAVEFLKVF